MVPHSELFDGNILFLTTNTYQLTKVAVQNLTLERTDMAKLNNHKSISLEVIPATNSTHLHYKIDSRFYLI